MYPLTLEQEQLLTHVRENAAELKRALVFMILTSPPDCPDKIYTLYLLLEEFDN